MSVSLQRLVYRSRARWPAPPSALDGILAQSLWSNARHGITGALGFSGRTYVQLLEGRPEAIEGLLHRLRADPRHDDLTVLLHAPTGGRLVPGWSMARVDLTDPAPRAAALIAAGDGLALAALLANLAHRGHTVVA